MLRNIAVPVLAPVPAFELGVVCEAFGLDRAPPGLPAYDFAVCGEQVTPVPTTSGFAVLPGHDLRDFMPLTWRPGMAETWGCAAR